MIMNTLRSIMLVVATMLCVAMMAQQKTLDECVYWIDHDISSSQSLGSSGVSIDVSSLSSGLHVFTMQVKDSDGMWSSAVTKYFVVFADDVESATITTRQYWFDNDISSAQTLSGSSSTVDLSGLAHGLHSFTMRVQNDAGLWSSTVSKFFIIPLKEEMTQVNIVRYMYWFDGIDYAAVVGEINQNSDVNQTEIVPIDVSNLIKGNHTISWQLCDSKGAWSRVYTDVFTTNKYRVGDVNCDNKVDVADVNAAINIILELKLPDDYPGKADITHDGKVDVSDVNAIINIILELH